MEEDNRIPQPEIRWSTLSEGTPVAQTTPLIKESLTTMAKQASALKTVVDSDMAFNLRRFTHMVSTIDSTLIMMKAAILSGIARHMEDEDSEIGEYLREEKRYADAHPEKSPKLDEEALENVRQRIMALGVDAETVDSSIEAVRKRIEEDDDD